MKHEKIRYVKHRSHKLGYGKNVNFGVRHTNGKFIHILNDDCFLNPNVVEKMMETMAPDVGATSHTLRYPDGSIQYAGKYRELGHGGGWGHIDLRAPNSRYTKPEEMEIICGASFIVRREVFYSVRGFDEDFYFYCEDDDLCMKIRQKGWKLMFTPLAEGIHIDHGSTHAIPGITAIMQDSWKLFSRKWKWWLEKNRNTYPGVW